MALTHRIARLLGLVGDQGNVPDSHGSPVRNAPSPLAAFVAFVGARGQRRRRRMATQPASAGQLRLRADGRWTDAGQDCTQGQALRIRASGRLFVSQPLEVSLGPKACLWYRFGDGPVARLARDDQVVVATQDGPLRLQANLPGGFESLAGQISRDNPPPPLTGELSVSVDRLANNHDAVPAPPSGWQYLWRLGQADIFHRENDELCCQTHGDVGILQHPVDLPLTADLRLGWSWLVSALPSSLPEHIQPTHDYVSLAVEFDNGLDLTYMWSARLATGTIFQCPLPWWDQRETHWVLRTPADGFDQWLSESRNLRDDYQTAIGGALPRRVVAVWLIANSAFQNGHGVCRYRGIRLDDPKSGDTVTLD